MKHNYQGDDKITAKIYNIITCYKCCQLSHYSGSCPFKEDEQEKLKDKGSILDNIVQGINRTTTCTSSMHVDHESDKSNRETENNSKSDNEDDDNSEPMPDALFHKVSYHINNDAGRLNLYWNLLDNQITVHMFRNRALLENIQDTDRYPNKL